MCNFRSQPSAASASVHRAPTRLQLITSGARASGRPNQLDCPTPLVSCSSRWPAPPVRPRRGSTGRGRGGTKPARRWPSDFPPRSLSLSILSGRPLNEPSDGAAISHRAGLGSPAASMGVSEDALAAITGSLSRAGGGSSGGQLATPRAGRRQQHGRPSCSCGSCPAALAGLARASRRPSLALVVRIPSSAIGRSLRASVICIRARDLPFWRANNCAHEDWAPN
jgi:hypothetical protein